MPYDSREARQRGQQILSYAQLTMRFLGRCAITAVRLPVLPQLFIFAFIYLRNHNYLLKYLEGTWEPGFPRAWTAWIAFLVTLPIFAGAQLVWLLTSLVISRRCGGSVGKGKGPSRDEDGYMMLNGGRNDEEDWEADPRARSHSARSRLPNLGIILWAAQCILWATVLLVGLYRYKHYEYEGDVRFRPILRKAVVEPRPQGYARNEKIFIAAAFYQNEEVIPYWTRSMLDAIMYMGTDNVFVSIVENYSNDRSPDLLREFAQELDRRRVRNRILVQDTTVKKPEHVEWNPRIEFLAAIRNQALEPLRESGGYDKVLFSNDIYIEPETIVELLETRHGDFDFACGLDFGHFGAYDMWVLRDRVGRLTAGYWPYFFDAANYEAVKAEEPVPVFSCWNGIVIFQADPILPVHLRSNKTLSTAPLEHPLPSHHPFLHKTGESPALTPPLAFRASAEGECYSSESFLLPYDFRRVMGLSKIYANPRVIVGYAWKYYVWHKWVLRQRYVKWFVEKVYDGAWMQYARMIVGDPKSLWTWDGVDCYPWWPH
ncbi:cryptococcal mannosyltransferase 1-domain-containing protein [Daedaleopsis nitida]|nr:cryptococcal mannosyltransferase 1-domain-containing protein [Daedaleopsis nitida]